MTRFTAPVCLVLGGCLVLSLGCEVATIPDDDPVPISRGETTGDDDAGDEAEQVAETPDRFESITKTPLPDPGDVAPVTDDPREFTAKDPVKGRRSRAVGGYLGAVGATRFYAQHQMTINSIKHAMQLFNATEGRYPNSHEEFMTKIIKFNQINLPELVEGEEYIYVPDEPEHFLQIRLKPAEEE